MTPSRNHVTVDRLGEAMEQLDQMLKSKIPGGETGIEVRKSVCAICDPVTQCGLDCYVKNGRIVKVEGTLENPQNAGTLCAKGAAQRQWVYHEDRLRTPLKRVGPRGSGQMVPISWTEALDTIAERLQAIKAESGPESVIFYCGYPKHPRPFLSRLATLYGSPNYCTESSACATAAGMAWRSIYGQGASPDIANTKCVFALGRNPFHAGTPQARHLFDARERGVKFIVADPRVTPLAAMADIHLQLRPGTDGALALAMANFIISQGLHDREFVAAWGRGFDEFRRYAAEFTLERAEEITTVPAAKIRDAAILYATSKPATMMPSSSPVVHHVNGVQYERATLMLVGLTGNFDIPGGNVAVSPSWLHVSGAGFTTREHEFELPVSWGDLPPRLGQTRFPVWTEMVDECQSMDIPRQVATGQPYPLRGLVAFAWNHRLWPDSKGFLAAADKLDFIVDVDLFLTDSAKHADIVLPTCSSLERSELRCYPQKYIVYTTPVIEPLGESRPDLDIVFAIADRLGLDYQVGAASDEAQGAYTPNGAPDFREAVEAAFDWMLEPSGMRVGELKGHPGGMPVPDPIGTTYRKYERSGFHTPSGKMEFSSTILEKYSDHPGIDGLPLYAEPPYSPVAAPDMAKDYPFVLVTGARLPMFIHSRLFRLPWVRSLRPEPAADLNPGDAARLGIRQGDRVELSTPFGSIQVNANLSHMVRPGDVHMFHGYPGADVNTLLSGDYLDPISGFPGYKAALCAVRTLPAGLLPREVLG
jgi:anaerobic selenocysteine-containing dehydrogenase